MDIKKIYLEETDSTNRYLRENDSGEEMIAVVAAYQTAGRGQGSNTWESERAKNLLFSILIRPTMVPVTSQFVLSMAEALALKSVLDSYTEDISLKWPNDIYWQDRKIGGTLIETSVAGNMLKTCIFGTGININQRQFRSDAPNPVSLCQIIGEETPVEQVFTAILKAFEHYYKLIQTGHYDEISTQYHHALYRRTGVHSFADSDGRFDAAIDHVESGGQLVLRDRSGKERKYAFKEVTFIIDK